MRLLADHEGKALFYCGDSRQMDALPDGSVQLIPTSPPYYNAMAYAQWPTYDAYLADMALVLAECWRVLCDGGRIAVNVPLGYGRPGNGGYRLIGDDWDRLIQTAGFEIRGHVIWDKGDAVTGTAWGSWCSPSNPSLRDNHEVIIVAHKGQANLPARGRRKTITETDFLESSRSIWRIPPVRHPWHPAPWPAEIARRLIQLYTYEGDTVLDCFSGSGTTAWEAMKAGRVGVGIDWSEEYVRQAAGPLFCTEPLPV